MLERRHSTGSLLPSNKSEYVQRYYWRELEDYIFIGGSPIPMVKEGGKTFILLENGELFNAEYAKRITKNGDTLKVSPISEKTIDGIEFSRDIQVGPLRLDIDHLTGLSLDRKLDRKKIEGDLTKFINLFLDYRKNNPTIASWTNCNTDFLKIPDLLNSIIEYANKTQSVVSQKSIELASSRIDKIRHVIDSKLNNIFSKARPVTNPGYTITMGGSGAGKEGLIKRAKKDFKDNAVVASLDDSRMFFDAYFKGAGGGLDYPHLAFCASIMREAIINKAIVGRYNLIQDCSGVPADKHIDFMNSLKKLKYQTTVYATTSTIYSEDLNKVGAITRAQWRYKKTHRWVPVQIILDKHIEVSKESQKFFDKVDKFVLNDNSGADKKDFTILETFNVSDGLVRKLRESKKESLFELFKEHGLTPTKSGEGTKFWKRKDGSDKKAGFEVVGQPNQKNYRIIAIYDQDAYESFKNKAQCNKHARDPQELLKKNPKDTCSLSHSRL